MATMTELRERSSALYTRLLGGGGGGREAGPEDADGPRGFSWFDPDDAAAAVAFAAELAIASGAGGTEVGLERALDLAESRTDTPPALVAQAMAIFVTHHRPARRLALPRTMRVRPELFAPSRQVGTEDAEEIAPTPEDALSYWREDPFANEHHEHWHQVYPYSGLIPSDWAVWAETTDRADLTALLTALDANADWTTILAQSTPEDVADRFLTLAQAVPDFGAFASALVPEAYRALFRLNDRQGELFFYMHNQMLARYDAERLSLGKQPVATFGPGQWAAPIPEGYTPPTHLTDYTARPPNEKLPQSDVNRLTAMQAALDTAVASGDLLRAVGAPRVVDRDSLGAATEASARQLTGLRGQSYPGIHNNGHGMLAALPGPRPTGVMNDPAAAIRDPVFWRWHRHIDQVNTRWQDTQPGYDFADAPPVVVRDTLAGAATPWTSPDIVLVDTTELAQGADPAAMVSAALGGPAFDTAVAPGPLAGADGLVVVDELTTRMTQSQLSDGRVVTHLTHEPFGLVVRVRNASPRPTPVTVRMFLAPAAGSTDRGTWMELDKHLVEVPGSGRVVVYRPDTEFSVVKKPAETDPQSVLDGATDPNDPDYCDCGWPYTLLLPRGTEGGMQFRLMVLCSDATRDVVRPSAGCGSMSFCGAVERYPDTRDMGYPFSRPFARPLETTLRAVSAAAGRTLTITHVGPR